MSHPTLHPKSCCRPLGLLGLLLAVSTASGAEFHLRSECRTEGGLVLVSDVAEVFASDPDEVKALGNIDLVPAPPDGQRRYLRVREIQDLLVLRGVNLRDHRFSGASQVNILGIVEAKPRETRTTSAPTRLTSKQAAEVVRKKIVLYLTDKDPAAGGWTVKVALGEEQTKLVAGAEQLAVAGGSSPWSGRQEFTVTCKLAAESRQVLVLADVTMPPSFVVATHTLARGSVVRPNDVRLQPGLPNEGSAKVFTSLEDVIGKETSRQIAEGQILDDQVVHAQLLVRRNEIVTVYSRTAGIQVRVSARTREDGAHGDLVTVESLAKRETYFARVVGPQTVEVYAHAMTAAEDTAARAPNAARLAAVKAATAQTAIPVSSESPVTR